MTNAGNNPDVDDALRNTYVTYSSSENASAAIQAMGNLSRSSLPTANGCAAVNLTSNGVQYTSSANLQSAMDNLDGSADVRVPTSDQNQLPLTFRELQGLEEDDVLYILDPDENEWTRYLFVCFEEEGFTVKQVMFPICSGNMCSGASFQNTVFQNNLFLVIYHFAFEPMI